MKITFEVSSKPISEGEVLQKFKDDWGYIRAPRGSPQRKLTFKPPVLQYFIATILTPEEYKGKIAGYCGVGFYNDLMTDGGAYTLGGKAAGVETEGNAIDVRGNGVYAALRDIRNNYAEPEANRKGIPFLILLAQTSTARPYYLDRGYVENSQNIPSWALESVRGRNWFVYNENEDKAMKKAWRILKMPKPYRGPDIRNEAQYEAASLDGRRLWHTQQMGAYHYRLKALRKNYDIDLTDVENPINKEAEYYRDMRAFHSRQAARLKKCIELGKTECNDYYSLELEGDDRNKIKYRTTISGQKDPVVELSIEDYNNLTDAQKIKYHKNLGHYGKDSNFHYRMRERLRLKLNQPTFPSPEHGGESVYQYKAYTKEEYENMTDDDKARYHMNEVRQQKRLGNENTANFHNKMFQRLNKKYNLPVYYSPEHEQEES